MKKLLLILLCLPLIGFGQTAEEYFDKAYNSSDYQYKIDNYTKCLRINPDYAIAYNNRGLAYSELGNYEDEIADYTRAIRIDPDYAHAYFNRGFEYTQLGNYEDAIADYTRAIRIDPDYASAYKYRGISKKKAGLSYCSDYKRACDLGKEKCCEWYYKQCK